MHSDPAIVARRVIDLGKENKERFMRQFALCVLESAQIAPDDRRNWRNNQLRQASIMIIGNVTRGK